MTIEEILAGVPQSVQREISIGGHSFSLDELGLDSLRCACQRPAECPGFNVTDLHHFCLDIKNAAGNVHRDPQTGWPWVEFHATFCCSVLNHVRRGDWFKHGVTLDAYRRAQLAMSAQAAANGGDDSDFWSLSFYITARPQHLAMLFDRETRALITSNEKVSEDEARSKIERQFAWSLARALLGRVTVSLRHEAPERYPEYGIVRMGSGMFAQLGAAWEAALTPGPERLALWDGERAISLAPGSTGRILKSEISNLKSLPGGDHVKTKRS